MQAAEPSLLAHRVADKRAAGSTRRDTVWIGMLWVASLAPFFFIGLQHPVQDLNEGLYARVAQEMLQSGNFVVPTLDGVPYLEKPPLLYWLTALGLFVFGRSDAVVRLAPMLGVLLTMLALQRFAARTLPARARAAAPFVLLSAPIVVVLGRVLLFDALLTGLLALALVLFHEWWRDGSRGLLRASYALLALAVLAKGFVALALFALVVVSFAASERRLPWRSMLEPGALAAFAAIAVPWHVAAALERPGFAWFYLVNEHVMRFLDRRVPHDYHTGPIWYYLARLPAYVFPWILVMLLPPDDGVDQSAEARSARRFLWLWLLMPLAFFSLAGNKGDYYLIVSVPPLALLIAERIARTRRFLELVPAAALLAIAVASACMPLATAPYVLPGSTTVLLALACILTCVSITALRSGHATIGIASCAWVALPLAMGFSQFIAVNSMLKSARPLAEAIAALHPAVVYSYRDYETRSSLAWYLDRPINVIDVDSRELWYGLTLKPMPMRFPSLSQVAGARPRVRAVLVVRDRDLPAVAGSPLANDFVDSLTVGRIHIWVSRPDDWEHDRAASTTATANAPSRKHRGG